MDAKAVLRLLGRLTLFEHVFDFLYWIAALAGLVLLGAGAALHPVLLALVCVVYVAAVLWLYYTVVRGVKRWLRSGRD
jgi:hypothetical protein